MFRATVGILLMITLLLPSSGFSTVEGATCGEVESYFRELDELMFDEMKEYFTDEAWMKDMKRMSRKADASESGLLTLTTEEMKPFIDITTVPGDVLLDYPENEIPEAAVDFHESSMSYWLIMPAMMRTIGSGGIFAAMAFTEDLESASADNAEALASLTATCPSLISQLSIAGEDFGLDGLTDEAEVDLQAMKDADAPEGFAFSLMILPAEEAEDA